MPTHHGRARGNGQRVNQITHYGIMGGLAPQRALSLSSVAGTRAQATNKLIIPPSPGLGLQFMLGNNRFGRYMLSRNPQCSGGIGRMAMTACGSKAYTTPSVGKPQLQHTEGFGTPVPKPGQINDTDNNDEVLLDEDNTIYEGILRHTFGSIYNNTTLLPSQLDSSNNIAYPGPFSTYNCSSVVEQASKMRSSIGNDEAKIITVPLSSGYDISSAALNSAEDILDQAVKAHTNGQSAELYNYLQNAWLTVVQASSTPLVAALDDKGQPSEDIPLKKEGGYNYILGLAEDLEDSDGVPITVSILDIIYRIIRFAADPFNVNLAKILSIFTKPCDFIVPVPNQTADQDNTNPDNFGNNPVYSYNGINGFNFDIRSLGQQKLAGATSQPNTWKDDMSTIEKMGVISFWLYSVNELAADIIYNDTNGLSKHFVTMYTIDPGVPFDIIQPNTPEYKPLVGVFTTDMPLDSTLSTSGFLALSQATSTADKDRLWYSYVLGIPSTGNTYVKMDKMTVNVVNSTSFGYDWLGTGYNELNHNITFSGDFDKTNYTLADAISMCDADPTCPGIKSWRPGHDEWKVQSGGKRVLDRSTDTVYRFKAILSEGSWLDFWIGPPATRTLDRDTRASSYIIGLPFKLNTKPKAITNQSDYELVKSLTKYINVLKSTGGAPDITTVGQVAFYGVSNIKFYIVGDSTDGVSNNLSFTTTME